MAYQHKIIIANNKDMYQKIKSVDKLIDQICMDTTIGTIIYLLDEHSTFYGKADSLSETIGMSPIIKSYHEHSPDLIGKIKSRQLILTSGKVKRINPRTIMVVDVNLFADREFMELFMNHRAFNVTLIITVAIPNDLDMAKLGQQWMYIE